MTMPSSLVAKPGKPWPPPRTDSASPHAGCEADRRLHVSTLVGRTTYAGWPARTPTAWRTAYSSGPGSMMSPPNSRRKLSTAELMTFLPYWRIPFVRSDLAGPTHDTVRPAEPADISTTRWGCGL